MYSFSSLSWLISHFSLSNFSLKDSRSVFAKSNPSSSSLISFSVLVLEDSKQFTFACKLLTFSSTPFTYRSKFSSFSSTCSSFGIPSPAIFSIVNTSSDSHSSKSESEVSCLNFLPSGERLSPVEDSEELFLDFRLTVSGIQHCQVRSKTTHDYSHILPDQVSKFRFVKTIIKKRLRRGRFN